MEKYSYVYMLTNKPNGVLYIGVTSDLVKRIYEHKAKTVEGLSKKYNLDKLVWYEQHTDIEVAITKEKQMKFWKRDWKIKRVEELNPNWKDLYDEICG